MVLNAVFNHGLTENRGICLYWLSNDSATQHCEKPDSEQQTHQLIKGEHEAPNVG